jgi:stage V sporulation protein G
MKITDIKVRKLFEEGPMRAIVSVTFDGQLAVHDIKVIYARDRYFIVMPSRKNADGTFHDIAHPIHSAFRTTLEEEVLAAYEQAKANYVAEAQEQQEEEAPELVEL